jgi:tetratricopeptide (TPR) repeat protein
VCALLLTVTSSAFAQTSDEMARRHFESGVAYLQESDYDNALKAFDKAYALSKRPAILVNIATVHERQGNLEQAVETLEKYLEAEPTGEHAETVRLRITNLKKRIQEAPPKEPSSSEPPPAQAQPSPASPAARPAPAPAPAPPPRAADASPNRVPAYLLLGVGALSAGGAVVTGIFAKGEYDDAEDPASGCSPTCSDDELSTGRTLALTSTLLTGVSIVSAGVGVALLLMGGSEEEAEPPISAVPALGVTLAPTVAGARAAWRF